MNPAHLTGALLQELARGRLAAAAEAAHLARCRACRDDLQVRSALWLDPTRATPPLQCVDPAILVRSAEGARLSPAERRTLRSHVPACGRCAGELEALTRAGEAAPAYPVRGGPGAAAGSLLQRLRELLDASMPPSLALAARGAAVARPAFDRAMKAYRRGDFAAARELLVAVRAEGESAPEVDFYLGCCWLQAERAGPALKSLTAAVGRRPRAGEYRYQLARALLAAGRLRPALAELERAAALPGPHKVEARQALTAARGTGGRRR